MTPADLKKEAGKGPYKGIPRTQIFNRKINDQKPFTVNNGQKVIVVANLSNETQVASFETFNSKTISLFGNVNFTNNNVQLNPYEVLVFELK